MNSSKYGNILTAVIGIAIIFIIVVIGVLGYGIISDMKDDETLSTAAINETNSLSPQISVANESSNQGEIVIEEGNVYDYSNSTSNITEKEMLNGYEVIGELTIPSIKLEEKVLSELTKGSLNTAVALAYTDRGLNQTGNTVIMGHNYKDGTFFSNNEQLKIGDLVYLEDKSGEKIKYEITEKFETTASDSSIFKASDTSKKILTLSTCTDDASTTDMRLILVAEEVVE